MQKTTRYKSAKLSCISLIPGIITWVYLRQFVFFKYISSLNSLRDNIINNTSLAKTLGITGAQNAYTILKILYGLNIFYTLQVFKFFYDTNNKLIIPNSKEFNIDLYRKEVINKVTNTLIKPLNNILNTI